jgi:heme-degrading monooxygenase HmoA
MIRVLIERRIAQGLEHYYDSTVKRTISQVIRAPGCITGESLKDSNDSRRRIIMSKWESLEDWENWLHSPERKNVVSELAPLLEGNERITMLEHTH